MGKSAERGVSEVLVKNTRTMDPTMADTRSSFVVPRLRVWGGGAPEKKGGVYSA